MTEQTTLFGNPRWTILLEREEADTFEETDFKVINRQENLFSNEYVILEIESLIGGYALEEGYTAEDVMCSTNALAVHEEFTNAVIITPDTLDDIADEMYCWQVLACLQPFSAETSLQEHPVHHERKPAIRRI